MADPFVADSPFQAGTPDPEDDPFVASTNQPPPLRFSGFDQKLFALGPASSPGQAKRALEAHLAETERRMAEAGKLGTALVQQQRELQDRLAEVESLEAASNLTPDLRQKLVEIERDYNDVARQTARAFLPKQRVPSNEAAGGSPYVPDGKSGRRSVSPSKFESQATGSPTKLSIPNRKLRNQPANRIHDIEFAAEISTSLIAQVRNLQALLAEKDEELRDAKNDNSRLEIDTEALQQRLKSLDESEHRYKEENWNLETQMQELFAAQKDASEREKRLAQALNVLQAEKTKVQRELDEVKSSHTKLSEEHAASVKQHDIELGTAKRNIATAENERFSMQRKLDDLTTQNQELAKAFSSQRSKMSERATILGASDDEFETATDNMTPDHSPPPSPIKGTPRHSMLESETLKTSLQHAQRTIQSQRSQLHREKTEKLELRRMLQDARDEAERLRNDAGPPPSRRGRKPEPKESRKYPKLLLGSHRTSREDIYMDDDSEWEEQTDQSSPQLPRPFSSSPASRRPAAARGDGSDQFETANETSDAAFETANERGTETEDFQTGAEEFSGSDSEEETETESPTRGTRRGRPSIMPLSFRKHVARESFDSTASTSNDEAVFGDGSTPTSSHPPARMRLRVSRGLLRRSSRQASEEPMLQSSPASFANSSASGTPRQGAQSLFAELADLSGSEEESSGGTPSRNAYGTPGSMSGVPPLMPFPGVTRLPMVDSGIMTEEPSKASLASSSVSSALHVRIAMADAGTMTENPAEPLLSPVSVVHIDPTDSVPTDLNLDSRMIAVDNVVETDHTRALPILSYSDSGAQYDPEIEEKTALLAASPAAAELPPPPELNLSAVNSLEVAPVEIPEAPQPEMMLSSICAVGLEPKEEPVTAPPAPSLSRSGIYSQVLDPKAVPEVLPPVPDLAVSQIYSHALEPDSSLDSLLFAAALGEREKKGEKEEADEAPELNFASITSQIVEPIAEPEQIPVVPDLTMAGVQSWEVEPRAEPAPEPPLLSMTTIQSKDVEPVSEPQVFPTLGLATIASQGFEPVPEPEIFPSLSVTGISSWEVKPRPEPEVLPEPVMIPSLTMVGIDSQDVEPRADPAPTPAALSLSSLRSEHVQPVEERKPAPLVLVPSPIRSESILPVNPSPLDVDMLSIGLTPIQSVETLPSPSRSPKRDGFILSRGAESPLNEFHAIPKKRSGSGFVRGSVLGWDKARSPTPPLIAEDDTSQPARRGSQPETPESQRPLQDMSVNSNVRPQRKPKTPMADSSAQTALTAEALDKVMNAKPSHANGYSHERPSSVRSNVASPGTVARPGSQDSHGSVIRHRARMMDARPSSASSSRAADHDLPPLPPNHREAIEAARSGSANGGQGNMGPPLWPASALKNRPFTPSLSKPTSPNPASPTPRPARAESATGYCSDIAPVLRLYHSRQSSVTSFASELDTRFNIQPGSMGMAPTGFGPNTDPRMIRAITETMIGEFLWKYTRKPGRGEMSENRHRRYFWVHPYTRTLYWSDRDPTTAGKSELRAKSVPIEAVRVVTDDNHMPPGLHRKSLVVVAPGRSVKFTCPTGQRHETWFNALSYLLLRTNEEGQCDVEELAGGLTREDVDEFNPQMSQGGYSQQGTVQRRPPPSVSSYNSRPRNNNDADMSLSVPTLTPTKSSQQQQQQQRPAGGTLGRISGYWKSGQVFSSMRSRSTVVTPDVYETSEVHDSAEDLRQMIERQDRESDRLENVRACCEGKHDVGTLHRGTPRSRSQLSHHHSSTNTPMSTLRARS